MEKSNKEIPRPGSRMARALHDISENDGIDGSSRASAVPGASAEATPGHLCETCGRSFKTKIGLGVHVRHAHPAVANAAVNVERDKLRWDPEEVRLMARAEATATLAGGIRYMNQHLHSLFPHRTIEAIKGKRRQEAYREMVLSICHQTHPASTGMVYDGTEAGSTRIGVAGPSSAIETANRCDPPASPAPQEDLERIRGAIRDLIEKAGRLRVFQASRLREIAGSALDGLNVTGDIERWLREVFPEKVWGHPQRTARRKQQRPPAKENREQKRRREYAMVQNLFRKNMRSCLNYIIDGEDVAKIPSPVDFDAYWRPILESVSTADGDMAGLRRTHHINRQAGVSGPFARGIHLEGVGASAGMDDHLVPDKSSLWQPITPEEVKRLVVRADSAAGLDGIAPRVWNSVPIVLRALLFNLLLLAREVPGSIAITRTVFLKKGGKKGGLSPSDFRPLSVGSVVLRQFHKILAQRLVSLGVVDERQRGFRPVDGVCENITILATVLREARRKCKSLHLACVDLSKAFDTVSHLAIYKALDELDLPPSFIEYIRNTYANAQTSLHLEIGSMKPPIKLGRGVRQGDPLSPLLFNLVVDRALGVLSEEQTDKLIN